MNRICIVIPYYGKWPNYLPLFLKSCSYNKFITFLFLTNLQPPVIYPSNVQFQNFEFSKIKTLLDQVLGFRSQLTTAYKLCDVRPAYGLLFSDFIANYEFWGWGDIDLIFGNIGNHLTDEIMASNDVISFRERWLSGSFCLIRNRHDLNQLFLKAYDKEKIFGTPDYKGFDEISKCWDQINFQPFQSIHWPNDNFTRLVLNEVEKGTVRSYFKKVIKESIPVRDYLIWDRGELTDNHGVSYSHYHFITEKRKPYFYIPQTEELVDKYYINRAGFYSNEEFKIYKFIQAKRIAWAFPGMVKNYLLRKLTNFGF